MSKIDDYNVDTTGLTEEQVQEVEHVLDKVEKMIFKNKEEEKELSIPEKFIKDHKIDIERFQNNIISEDELMKHLSDIEDVDVREHCRFALLNYGIQTGNFKLFEKLDLDFCITPMHMNNLLLSALEHSRMKTVQYLLEKSMHKNVLNIDEGFAQSIEHCLKKSEYGLLEYLLEEMSNPKRQDFHNCYDFKNAFDIVCNNTFDLDNDLFKKLCVLLLNHGAFLKDEHCERIKADVNDEQLLKIANLSSKIREEFSEIMYGKNIDLVPDFSLQCLLNENIQNLLQFGAELEFDDLVAEVKKNNMQVKKKMTIKF